MDDTDRKILALLRRDASSTNETIGRAVGLTEAAVRRRVHRLRSDGVILRYTVVTTPLGPEGLVLIRCRPGRTSEILRHLSEIASEVFETSGEFDLGAVLEQPTMEAFNRELDRLRALEGVLSTVTLVRLARTLRPTSGPVHGGGSGSGAGRVARGPLGSPRPGP